MSKQDVIDYVMETPHNTNRAVLEGLVDTAVEESQVQADWDQNDETAKDYIKTNPQSTLLFPPLLKMQSRIKWSKRRLMRYRIRLRNILVVKFQTKN